MFLTKKKIPKKCKFTNLFSRVARILASKFFFPILHRFLGYWIQVLLIEISKIICQRCIWPTLCLLSGSSSNRY